MEKVKVGITVGDINGIGLEVILKALHHEGIFDICTPVIYGSTKVVSYHKNILPEFRIPFQGVASAERLSANKINVVNCWSESVNITLGRATEDGGKYAWRSLDCAVEDLKKGLIDVLVTAPINKQAMEMAGFQWPGHTEYLTEKLGAGQSLMFMISDDVRVGLVTNHVPLRKVPEKIHKDRVIEKVRLMEESLRIDFGIERPLIAVLGLNPHAGEQGRIGNEEVEVIRPAVVELKNNNYMVMGPFPADGFFGSAQHRHFHGIMAMYHDQGLIPFKLLTFGQGCNFTAGLPYVRTSPDHGTGYDLTGKGEASEGSMLKAIFTAIDIFRNRQKYKELEAAKATPVISTLPDEPEPGSEDYEEELPAEE